MFYIETKERHLAIISDIQNGITFLILTLVQICNHHFKCIFNLFQVIAVLLRYNVFEKNCHMYYYNAMGMAVVNGPGLASLLRLELCFVICATAW